jgi:hypothetical protein
MITVPQEATTVILLRERAPGDFELFPLKRHEKAVTWAAIMAIPAAGLVLLFR